LLRSELEHAIRVATEILDADSVLIIGSQSILGSWDEDELPIEATLSVEVDIAPLHDDAAESLATKLDGVAGELSGFHERHGYYIQGVGRTTAILPTGWENRLVPLSSDWTMGRVGLCLNATDLCVAKLAAHREKDLTFVHSLLSSGLIDRDELRARANLLDDAVDPRTTDSVCSWVDAWSATVHGPDELDMPDAEQLSRRRPHGGIGSNQYRRKPG